MSYDYINNEKVDLSRQDHRDDVIRRNKKLQSAINNGTQDFEIHITIKVTMDCVKCGGRICASRVRLMIEPDDLSDLHRTEYYIPDATCLTCKTKYKFDPIDKVYELKLPTKKS